MEYVQSDVQFYINVKGDEMPQILALCDELAILPEQYFIELHREFSDEYMNRKRKSEEKKSPGRPKKY